MKKDTGDGSGRIVGVDLGDRWSRYCVLDQHGKVLEEDTVATTGRAFRKPRVSTEGTWTGGTSSRNSSFASPGVV